MDTSKAKLKLSIEHLVSLFKHYFRMVFNAGSLIISRASATALGFFYWVVAARYYPQESVGLATAAISSMLFLGEIGVFGLTSVLVGQLSRKNHKSSTLISTAIIVTIFTAGIPALLFGLIAPKMSRDLGPISSSIPNLILYGIGVVATSASTILDFSTIGLERGELQLWRNIAFAVAKLVALVVAAAWISSRTGMMIYGTWAIGSVFSMMILLVYFFSKGTRVADLIPDFTLYKELRGLAVGHYALNLAANIPGMVLPILITILLSVSATASFYVAWMITSFFLFVPSSLAIALYAAAAKHPETGQSRMRFSILLSLAFGIVANIVVSFLAKPILAIFGEIYVVQAEQVLRILALSVFPHTILAHYVAKARIQETANKASPVIWLGAILQLAFASVGAKLFSTIGFSAGWLIGLITIAIIIMPGVIKSVLMPQVSSN
jgi:O-antigen/teichoic acid export membrane protein